MPRALHIILTVNATWNIVNFRMPLVRALIADGHTVTVLAPHDEAAAELVDAGCQCVYLPMDKKGLNPLQDAKLFFTFRRHFIALRPDIILGFTIKNNIFGALASKSVGIPFVPNVTGLGTAFLSGGLLLRLASLLYRSAFNRLPVIFFQNRDDKELFTQSSLVSIKQARILPGSGIDLEQFSPSPYPAIQSEIRFLFIGRIIRDKGVTEFVEAARIIQAKRNDMRFQILGAIGFANRTSIPEQDVQGWQDDGLIDYLGTTDDVRDYIAQAHCIVLPSYREGAPRTLIEGAALARPAIATDVAGCNAVVEAGFSGLLCRPKDAASLAEAMISFADSDPEDKVRMGRNAREKIEQEYSAERVVEAYRSVIAGVVK